MVLVWMVVFGAMAKSGGRHLVGRQYGGRHLSAWLVPPDSLDHHQPKLLGDGGRESQVEQMIIVAKEAGQWRWVIVAHLE